MFFKFEVAIDEIRSILDRVYVFECTQMYTICSNRKQYVSQQLSLRLIYSSLSDLYPLHRPGYEIHCPQNMTCIKFTFDPPTQSSTIRRDENPYEILHPVVQQYQKPFPRPTCKETHFNNNTQQEKRLIKKMLV